MGLTINGKTVTGAMMDGRLVGVYHAGELAFASSQTIFTEDFESGWPDGAWRFDTAGWRIDSNGVSAGVGQAASGSKWLTMYNNNNNTNALRRDVQVVSGGKYRLSFWRAEGGTGRTASATITAGGKTLASLRLTASTDTKWHEHTLDCVIPAGTSTVTVSLISDIGWSRFDLIRFQRLIGAHHD